LSRTSCLGEHVITGALGYGQVLISRQALGADQRGRATSRRRALFAHQLISGSSITACHNPACTARTIEGTGSHSYRRWIANRSPEHTLPRFGSSRAPKFRDSDCASCIGTPCGCCFAHHGAVGSGTALNVSRQGVGEFACQRDKHDAPYTALSGGRSLLHTCLDFHVFSIRRKPGWRDCELPL
jgi:hypothetical protein